VPALCATPGRDGVGNITGAGNTYYPSTANVAAGATSIPVGAPVGGTLISAGDLLLIIQMQDAVIDSSNTNGYGDGTGGIVPALVAGTIQPTNDASGFISGTAGRYEYVVATGPVVAGSVPIKGTNGGGLINAYFSSAATAAQGQQTYQIIRVPQYTTATIGVAVPPTRWNGRTGGIITYDVAGNFNLGGGTIDANGAGFRGGGGRVLAGAVSPNTDYRTLSTLAKNGSKAEGLAGTPRFVIDPVTLLLIDNGILNEGYPNGSYGRGAPGNAGGGSTDSNSNSNDENSGGGGGSNGGFGGAGGRGWNSDLPSGGFGGAPFAATTGSLVLGGGGGAGTTNNATPDGTGIFSSGASGGGMVMIRTNTVSGAGTINANGTNARDVQNDGGGGGGAGGSVLVSALSNSVAGLTVNANGGNGGIALVVAPHGPGGGGGGGVVITSPGAAISVLGGTSGLTGTPPTLTNGAIAGEGVTIPYPLTTIPGASSGASCNLPKITLVKRITAINNINIGGFADDTTSAQAADDNDPKWPSANTQYLRGAVTSDYQSNDLIEYTIYFLSNGTTPVRNVQFCDRIPANTIFEPNGYGTGNGILLGWDSTGAALPDPANSTVGAGKVALSNAADADIGQFIAPNVSVAGSPSPCNNGGSNPDGAIIVQLGAAVSLPNATGSGTPINSYGFVRFKVRVK